MAITPPADITKGFFAYLGDSFHSLLSGFVEQASQEISNSFVIPFLSVSLVTYFLIKGYLIAFGKSDGAMSDLLFTCSKLALIIFIGANTGNYLHYVVEGVNGLQQALTQPLVNAISGGTNVSVDSAWSVLDQLWSNYFKQISQIWENNKRVGFWGGILDFFDAFNPADIALKILSILLFFVSAVLVTSISAGILILSEFHLIIALSLGQIFFSLWLFPATREFFNSWLKSLLTPLISMVLIVVTISLFSAVLNAAIQGVQKTFDDQYLDVYLSLTISVITALLTLCIVLVIKQMPQIASSLVGGAGISAVSLGSMAKSMAQGALSATAGSATAGALIANGVGKQALGNSLKNFGSNISNMSRYASGYEIAGSALGGIAGKSLGAMTRSEQQRFNDIMQAINRSK